MAENDEVVDPIIDGDETPQTDDEVVEPTVEELKEQNKKLFERAKKAEGFTKGADGNWIKKPKAQDPKPEEKKDNSNADAVSSDELKLIARGLSDEEITKAKVIAKGLGITLPEALKDDLFLVFQKDLKEKQRKEAAKLGASKGSGQDDDGEESVIKPGMNRDEHKEAWKKVVGKK